jgi:serine/threonine-protein kinase RsbW
MFFTDKSPEPFGTTLLDITVPTQISLKMPLVFRMLKVLGAAGCLAPTGSMQAELCFDEAMTNAMIHGNKLDPERKIRVIVFADDTRWGAIIDDEGAGFTEADLPKPGDPETLLRENGRGIMLMKNYLDEVMYSSASKRLFMVRRRQTGLESGELQAALDAATVSVTAPPPPAATGPVAVVYENGVAVVEILSARVNELNSGDVRSAASTTTGTDIVLDMTRVEYISSVGVSAVLSARKTADGRHGRLVLCGLQHGVREVLKSLGLIPMLKTAPDRKTALESLETRP